MLSSMFLVGLGALLVLCGVVFIAGRMIWAGPLSQARRSRTSIPGATLEPRGRSSIFDVKAQLPGIGLLAMGIVLLIAASAV
ncbi:hypothetical protein [Microvirga brassicacearum]|uniref:Uncharacterized protein n=1 Tax=Microvirga brassicacearum TaxID=2580413 RepID=A0A5N3P8A6_9HYPH|nr:hypothetical protein [Microvirga brassicacearum]KAB0265948.1 hypothetical protein FEZ63_16085 [Microvirga brassicacearum]